MENRMEKRSTKSPKTPQSARQPSRSPTSQDILSSFSPLFNLLKNDKFKSALKTTYIDEFIPFIHTIQRILSHKTITIVHLEKLQKFFPGFKSTGLYSNKTQSINLNDESLKRQLLLLVQKDSFYQQNEVASLFESLLQDCRTSILNTLLGYRDKYEEFTKILSNMSPHNTVSTGFSPS